MFSVFYNFLVRMYFISLFEYLQSSISSNICFVNMFYLRYDILVKLCCINRKIIILKIFETCIDFITCYVFYYSDLLLTVLSVDCQFIYMLICYFLLFVNVNIILTMFHVLFVRWETCTIFFLNIVIVYFKLDCVWLIKVSIMNDISVRSLIFFFTFQTIDTNRCNILFQILFILFRLL